MSINGQAGRLPARRTVLGASLAAALAGVLGTSLTACTAPRPSLITVAGGEPGGFYLEFARLLAASLQRHGVADRAEVAATGGSLDNIGHLLAGTSTLAVALADAASGEVTGQAKGTVVALGKVYENYVHALVRRDSGITGLRDLAGRTVGTGRPGSGTSLIAPRIIEVAGLSAASAKKAGREPVTTLDLGLNDGLPELAAGHIDALFWSGGVPTAAIASAHREAGLALLDLSGTLPGLRRTYGSFYDKVLVPEGSYAGMPAVWTVGVANLLLCRADLDAATVKSTVELLVSHAGELIPQSSLGVQFLSPESLINTGDVPLHPAAADAYRELHG